MFFDFYLYIHDHSNRKKKKKGDKKGDSISLYNASQY